MKKLFTDASGRIRRTTWWKGFLVIVVASLVAAVVLSPVLLALGIVGRLLMFALSLVFLYGMLMLGSKRLHDRNKDAMPRLAFFYGPSVFSQLLQALGIGWQAMEVTGREVMVPGLFGGIVLWVSMGFGIWALIEQGFLSGDVGSNRFGEDPKAPLPSG